MKKKLELESPRRFECLGQEWSIYSDNGDIYIEICEKYGSTWHAIKISWASYQDEYMVKRGYFRRNPQSPYQSSDLWGYDWRPHDSGDYTEHLTAPVQSKPWWRGGSTQEVDVNTIPDLIGQKMRKIVNKVDPPVERFSGEELIPDFCEETS